MKRILFPLAVGMVLATSANAGGLSFSLPNLDYPTAETVTVGKDCALSGAQATQCNSGQ